MAKTQATTTPFASASVAAAAEATGSAIDVTAKAGCMIRVKITSGATAPTVAPTLRVISSEDNSIWDADVAGGRFVEKISLPIPAATVTAYYPFPFDVTFNSYIKPIVKNEDTTQSITVEIVAVTTSF